MARCQPSFPSSSRPGAYPRPSAECGALRQAGRHPPSVDPESRLREAKAHRKLHHHSAVFPKLFPFQKLSGLITGDDGWNPLARGAGAHLYQPNRVPLHVHQPPSHRALHQPVAHGLLMVFRLALDGFWNLGDCTVLFGSVFRSRRHRSTPETSIRTSSSMNEPHSLRILVSIDR
jgi:hypothetical protein